MPKLGADMLQGRLIEWVKKPGDRIERGEIIATIETDKANVDVESFLSGVVERILVEPTDEWIDVGTPLAVIAEAASTIEAPRPVTPTVAMRSTPVPRPPPAVTAAAAPAPHAPVGVVEHAPARIRISPLARKRATALGLDMAALRGTGPHGRIVLRDIETAQPPIPVAPALPALVRSTATDKRTRMREAIAAAMTRSKREIPHYYLGTTIDLGRLMQWLSDENVKRSVVDRLIAGVVFIKAIALALREIPELNGFFTEGRAQATPAIHVGTAISLRGGGLIAPALLDTDQRSLTDLMHAYQDLVQRARAGSLRSAELTDATITVSSLGDRGVETLYGVIYPPQVALIGLGRIVERPWIVDGAVVARPVIHATLSADHRASDGHRGALFLDRLSQLLQEPDAL
ncbi:MAG: dihydrolipoamide acetyltransferase family protein [Burkholderiales bacterium]